MPPNGRWLCSVMGGAKVLLFSLFPWDCWCCIFHYLFSISTHGRLTWFFSALCFYWYFLRNSEVPCLILIPFLCSVEMGTAQSLIWPISIQVCKGRLRLFLIFSSACYRSGCLAPGWSFRFLFLLISNSDLSVVPEEKKCARYGYILLNLESVRVHR